MSLLVHVDKLLYNLVDLSAISVTSKLPSAVTYLIYEVRHRGSQYALDITQICYKKYFNVED